MSNSAQYAFSDGELAEKRLGLLADTFSESTRAFLNDALDGPTSLAIDLGCGPGHTTHLLAESLACEHVIGLDESHAFINSALRDANDQVSFLVHDVNDVPFPVGPADVIFSRLLLTHLEDPRLLITRWASQLTPGGSLLLEEAEDIRTDNKVLIAYMDIVMALLASQGNDLYVGRKLAELNNIDGLRPILNRRHVLNVPEHQAAALFSMNIKVWKSSEFIKATYQNSQITELEEQLTSMANDREARQPVEWQMRQLAFRNHRRAK